jgi:aconitate hydratase
MANRIRKRMWQSLRRSLRRSLHGSKVHYFSLAEVEKEGLGRVSGQPVTVKILLESLLRNGDPESSDRDIRRLLDWRARPEGTIPFLPARVLMQDFTGVPAVVDLAAMRDALVELGGDPGSINPQIPVDLIIDHSVQVDQFGFRGAFAHNAKMEFQRNRERYEFLRWASKAFDRFSVVPPATGICHQVNLEYLARVVQTATENGSQLAFPDTLLGTDSHTTMVNGLGVLGWGVGGIEAEAAILGQSVSIPVPSLIGYRLTGDGLRDGVTATDLVLTITQALRSRGVVGKFVEFFGPGLASLRLPDRATISNMCPEYGATAALFPVDQETLSYLKRTGRSSEQVALVEEYSRAQGFFRTADEPDFEEILELDIETVEPSIAGPSRPQDRVRLSEAKQKFRGILPETGQQGEGRNRRVKTSLKGREVELLDGSVVISAITSCTNTSNPSVMVAAGLLAKKAVEVGLSMPPYVKTSLAPGSRVVTRYLELAGLTPYLEKLGYHLVGFGCTTCIGNSGPLDPEVSRAIVDNDLVAVSVLSGNRNFEGRIHQEVRANYLASPPLVIAYGLAGTIDIDLSSEPLAKGPDGREIFLKDIWPAQSEIEEVVARSLGPELFTEEYRSVFTGNDTWNSVTIPEGRLYRWDDESTYIRKPSFFADLGRQAPEIESVRGARILAILGDSVTTDHISPAGMIASDAPAAKWLIERGVSTAEYNTYGSRRGNHEVMVRGTFGNIRIRNRMVADEEGGFTLHFPQGERMSIFDAAMLYQREGIPLVVFAGKDYGMGSSRDWAAKGTLLLGVKAVFAESFERIHRSNLIGMGILPLQMAPGEAASLALEGQEVLDIEPVRQVGQKVRVEIRGPRKLEFFATSRIDSSDELLYYRNGGILHTVLRKLAPRESS